MFLVKTCKERWKNIRTVFRRNVVFKTGGLVKRPYYLNDEMQFMMQFLQSRGRAIISLKDSDDGNSQEETDRGFPEKSTKNPLTFVEAVMKRQASAFKERPFIIKKEVISDEEDFEPMVLKTALRTPQIAAPIPDNDTPRITESEWNEGPLNKKLRTDCTCSSDSNMQFLLSLKPDLEQMNMEQKRKLKKGIFDLLANIMDSEAREG